MLFMNTSMEKQDYRKKAGRTTACSPNHGGSPRNGALNLAGMVDENGESTIKKMRRKAALRKDIKTLSH
jgi:hypothetical protein